MARSAWPVPPLRPAVPYRVAARLRRWYLTRLRWHFGGVGAGLIIEPHVHLAGARHMYLGDFVRLLRGSVIYAWEGQVRLGFGVVICHYAILNTVGGTIAIGDRTSVGDFSNLYGQGGLTIGNDVQISSGCRMIPKTNIFADRHQLISQQRWSTRGITIEDDVWIGVNCVILDGVTIGRGAVIGAGAVVTADIPPYSIAVGVPARVKGTR